MKRLLIPLFIVSLFSSCSRPDSAPSEATPAAEEKEVGEEGERKIEMTLEAQKNAGLSVVPAEVKRLTEYLEVPGTIQPIDSRVAHIRPIANGRLSEVRVRVGDRVGRDQILAVFDNNEAGDVAAEHQSARAELQRLKTQLSVAALQTERNRRLAEIGAASRKELELSQGEQQNIEASIQTQETVIAGLQTKLKRFGGTEDGLNTSIRSPLAGVVTKVDASPGEIVSAEAELFEIADLSQVWVQAEVFEKDLGRIQVGQMALIAVDTYANQQFQGRVSYIADILDPQTRTAKVRSEVDNPGHKLKLDMFATVRVPTTLRRDALAVPEEAIQQLEGRTVVFVQTDETKFEARTVQVGSTVQGMTEIIGGIEKGASIVTRGAFKLKSIALSGQLGEGEEEEEH
jgi:cobalt-zinc-cadmium efflux system membrane fusion protein